MTEKLTNTEQQQEECPANKLHISFDYEERNNRLFTLTQGEYDIRVSTQSIPSGAYTKIPPHSHSNIHAHFRQAFPNADISCTAHEDGIAENVIIKDNSVTTYSFVLEMKNLISKRVESERRILLYDAATDEPAFAVIDPLALDANGCMAPPLFCNTQWEYPNRLCFTLCIDREWLQARERAFPVTLYTQILHVTYCNEPVTEFEDFSADDLLFFTGLRHCYTTDCNFHREFWEKTFPTMKIGTGWHLNIAQNIAPIMQNGIATVYVYRNEYGNQTILFKSDQLIDNELDEAEDDEDDDYYDYDIEKPSKTNAYCYKSTDGTLCYNPSTRVLTKDHCIYQFDILGRLRKTTDTTGHSVYISYKNGRILSVSNGLQQYFRFAYTGDHLSAIVGPYNNWVQYRYTEDRLSEVVYANGHKLFFPTESRDKREIAMHIKDAEFM